MNEFLELMAILFSVISILVLTYIAYKLYKNDIILMRMKTFISFKTVQKMLLVVVIALVTMLSAHLLSILLPLNELMHDVLYLVEVLGYIIVTSSLLYIFNTIKSTEPKKRKSPRYQRSGS